MEWISVKDRLPEIDAWILAYGEPENEQNPKIALVQFKEWTNRYYFQYLSSGCGCCDSDMKEVTHWMPLPELPK